MKFVSKAIALSAFAALAACGGGGDDAAENIEASADNQAAMLEMEAENLMAQADNATGAAEMTLDNQADAPENPADHPADTGALGRAAWRERVGNDGLDTGGDE